MWGQKYRVINAEGPYCDLDLRCELTAGTTLRAACEPARFIPHDPEITRAALDVATLARPAAPACPHCVEMARRFHVVCEALEWYASPRTWRQWLPDSAGDRARRALDFIKGVNRAAPRR